MRKQGLELRAVLAAVVTAGALSACQLLVDPDKGGMGNDSADASSSTDPSTDPCSRVRCKAGTHCESTSGSAQCVPDQSDNPCDKLSCDPGTHCELKDVQCVRAPCLPVAECVADSNGGGSGVCNLACVKGKHCEIDADGKASCVDDATSGGVTCGKNTCAEGQVCCNASCGICTDPGQVCIQIACEDPGAAPSCASVKCKAGTMCVDTPQGPQCIAQEENPCNTVDCKPDARCEVVNGAAQCVPVSEPSSCAATLCPTNTYCDDISGTAKCIPLPSCDSTKCEAGSHCELKDVQCVRAPCPPQPTCVPDADECGDPCATARCKAGTHCESKQVVCIKAPCCPVAQCVSDSVGVSCGKNTCKAGDYCCNESCGICAPKGSACIQQFCN